MNPLRFGVLVIIGPPRGVRLQSVRANFEGQEVNTTVIPRPYLATTSLDHRPFTDLQVGVISAKEEADVLTRYIRSRQHYVAFWITSNKAFFT
jgi:hypothetical protein